jgi:hypothetical protein
MTCDKTALNCEICKEGHTGSHAAEGLFEPPSADGSCLQAHFTRLELHSDETYHQVSGEQTIGVGSQLYDHETCAWNPRFMSVNYALSRLTKANK